MATIIDPGTDSFLPTRQSLLSRLRDCEDQAGWREFFDSYWRLIYNVARKSAGCANHIGDPGIPLTNGYAPFSFSVPAGARFEVVVMQLVDVPACPDYTLTLYGLPCPRPKLHIVKDSTPNNVLLQWSTAYPGWNLQSVNALGELFQNFSAAPVILNSRYTITNPAAGEMKFYRLKQ